MPATTRSVNDIADEVLKLQAKRKKLESQAELIKKQEDDLKKELRELAESLKLTFGGNKKSAWKVEMNVVPQVADWDAFYAYIKAKDYFHLLERRPTVKGCRELWELGGKIDGVEKFSKMVVSVKEV